ncbi:MAG: MarR family transcriptional regulator [Thiotrichaceae bacterium]
MYTSHQASQEEFLHLVRELVSTYQVFIAYSHTHFRSLNLTMPQFDVIATLGNTTGMNFKELGQKTLITKGTLTGVIDRLEEKGLVTRVIDQADRRMFQVTLTTEGQALFEKVFPAHILFLKTQFDQLTIDEQRQQIESLRKLKQIFPIT